MSWRLWWTKIRDWWKDQILPPPLSPPEPPAPISYEPEPEPLPPKLEAEDTEPTPERQRSAAELEHLYELERMKHDKFVKPKNKPKSKPKKKEEKAEDEEEIDVAADEAAHPAAKPIPEIDGQLVPDDHTLVSIEGINLSGNQIVVDEHHEGGKVLYKESEFWGEFSFRDTILEQLERYWVYLRRMRKHDPDSYGMYRAVGAHLTPYMSTFAWDPNRRPIDDGQIFKMTEEEIRTLLRDLPPYFKEQRPAFGCVAFGTNPIDEQRELQARRNDKKWLWIPKFLYWTKYRKPPAEWQPMPFGGDYYAFTVWWDRPHDPEYNRKHGVPQSYALWISKDGSQVIPLKKRHAWNRWEYPHSYRDWAKSHGVPVKLYLAHIFITAVRDWESANLSSIRVNVHKGSLTAVFGIAPARLAYFFQDREVTVDNQGHTSRIFHYVKPHQRKTGTLVKGHFRGLREFDWAGYHVQITVPGLHHTSLTAYSYGVQEHKKFDKKWVTQTELGELMADYIRTGDMHDAKKELKDKVTKH